MLLSDWVCFKPCFGAGMLVSGRGWKILLEGAVELACWCYCKGWYFRVLQGGGYVLYPARAARVLVKGAAARCRVRATAECCFQVLQLKWSVHFRVGMLVPLQDAAAGCCGRILFRSSRRCTVVRGEWLQKKLTKHKFWSCKSTKIQNWEIWGIIRV